MLNITAVAPDLKIMPGANPPKMPNEIIEIVDRIWQAETAERGSTLFNGPIFSVENISPSIITGWISEYKFFLAQRRHAELFNALHVRPLALTGLLLCQEGVVIGRRSGNVEQDAGLWELVPSGGIDGITNPDGSIDLNAHLMNELLEETGIRPENVSNPIPFALIEDTESHVCDISLALRTKLSRQEIFAIFYRLANREYTQLEVVPTLQLTEVKVTPVSRTILKLANSVLTHS